MGYLDAREKFVVAVNAREVGGETQDVEADYERCQRYGTETRESDEIKDGTATG